MRPPGGISRIVPFTSEADGHTKWHKGGLSNIVMQNFEPVIGRHACGTLTRRNVDWNGRRTDVIESLPGRHAPST